MCQYRALGRTMDSLRVYLGRATVSTVPFLKLASETESMPWADENFGAENGSMASLHVVRNSGKCRGLGQ